MCLSFATLKGCQPLTLCCTMSVSLLFFCMVAGEWECEGISYAFRLTSHMFSLVGFLTCTLHSVLALSKPMTRLSIPPGPSANAKAVIMASMMPAHEAVLGGRVERRSVGFSDRFFLHRPRGRAHAWRLPRPPQEIRWSRAPQGSPHRAAHTEPCF